MIEVDATEFRRNIGKYQDVALKQPVLVTRKGRESTVLLSAYDYQDLRDNYINFMELDDITDGYLAANTHHIPRTE